MIVSIAGCATEKPQQEPPPFGPIPDGWIHDYDYQSSLTAYLRNQHAAAAARGERAYVYLYVNGLHCRETRRLTQASEAVAQAYDGIRIVMLNEHKMPWHKQLLSARSQSTRMRLPAIIAITPDGKLDQRKSVFPDIYLFHRELVRSPPIDGMRGSPLVNSEIAALIRRKFDSHLLEQ
ncbi:MAG: hypothetical protein AAAFM81_14800 [Pseudomonadota bacterium]